MPKIPTKVRESLTSAEGLAKQAGGIMAMAETLLTGAYEDLRRAGYDEELLQPVAESIDLARLKNLTAKQLRARLRAFRINPDPPEEGKPAPPEDTLTRFEEIA